MTPHATPIDISNIPELLQIVEEVEATQKPRELNWKNKTVAVIAPVPVQGKPKTIGGKSKADYEAFLSAAGGWKGLVDTEQLKKDIYESRSQASRPSIKL